MVKSMAAEVVVAHTNFIAYSRASKEALKSAKLLQNLPLNALIQGEEGTGKTTLAKFIFPDVIVVSAKNANQLTQAIQNNKRVIIKDFHLATQPLHVKELIQKNSTHVVATVSSKTTQYKDDFFSISIYLPPLKERKEDIFPLVKLFTHEIDNFLSLKTEDFLDEKIYEEHLVKNAHSLKRFIYINAMANSLNSEEFLTLSEFFISKEIEQKKSYKELLCLLDVPVIKAGLKAYNSKLALANALELNRNTLRKKINENKKYFKGNI